MVVGRFPRPVPSPALSARGKVPEPDSTRGFVDRRHCLAVGRNRDLSKMVLRIADGSHNPSCGYVPNVYGVVPTDCDQRFAIGGVKGLWHEKSALVEMDRPHAHAGVFRQRVTEAIDRRRWGWDYRGWGGVGPLRRRHEDIPQDESQASSHQDEGEPGCGHLDSCRDQAPEHECCQGGHSRGRCVPRCRDDGCGPQRRRDLGLGAGEGLERRGCYPSSRCQAAAGEADPERSRARDSLLRTVPTGHCRAAAASSCVRPSK